MELLDRKIVRIPLYGLFTLVVFLAALVLTFPDERVKQIELLDDVVAHLRRGGGGKGVQAGIRKHLAQRSELAILRAKIVPPVADAVGLVHNEGEAVLFAQVDEMVKIGKIPIHAKDCFSNHEDRFFGRMFAKHGF